jgi:hypothetical protein
MSHVSNQRNYTDNTQSGVNGTVQRVGRSYRDKWQVTGGFTIPGQLRKI